MIYTKITNREANFETIVSLEEGIFTDCNTCEREIQLEGEVMKHILEEGDLASTKIICKDCTAEKFKKEAKKMIIVNTTQKNAEKFNENPKNFLLVEAMKIFTESNDEKVKLQALELIRKVEATY